MRESGISIYFRQDKIRIRFKTIEQLGNPEHIHLRINEEKKYMFLEKCERDIDSFRIEYHRENRVQDSGVVGKKIKDKSCYVHAKRFLEYLSHVIGVPQDSPSLFFAGYPQPDGTVFIDLNHYTVINYEKDGKRAAIKQEPDEQQ